ncbi:MAG: amidohydrolase family protein [Cytophagaceae bacterium]
MFKTLLRKISGNFKSDPSKVKLSNGARNLIQAAFEGIEDGKFFDNHVHILGMNTEKTGCWTNPSILNWKHPLDTMKTNIFINASGIDDVEKADEQYLDRLNELTFGFPKKGKFLLLPLDKCYNKDGTVNQSDTKFYVPNEYVYSICKEHPEEYVPAASIHPYRKDAVAELEKWAILGVRIVKWIPNTMGMDPSDSICEPFYEKMKEYDMVLLGHAGKESAMEVAKFKTLGNPLLYRKPLDHGVKVIIAHCAGLGSNIDFDCPHKRPVKNYKLFLRLMKEKKYEGLVFGDISALTQMNRMGKPLKTMLKRKYLHHRLLNGSDYPLPAINSVVLTKAFVAYGYLNEVEADLLNEVYKMNPLLFDFVLKRTIRHPETKGKFSLEVFINNPVLNIVSL